MSFLGKWESKLAKELYYVHRAALKGLLGLSHKFEVKPVSIVV